MPAAYENLSPAKERAESGRPKKIKKHSVVLNLFQDLSVKKIDAETSSA